MSHLEKEIQYIGALEDVFVNKLNTLQFAIKSQEESSFHVKEISTFPNQFVNAVIDDNEYWDNEIRIQTATEYFKDKLLIFFAKPLSEGGNTAQKIFITKQPKCYDAKVPFAMIPVFAGKDDEEEKTWIEGRIKKGDFAWEFRREYKDFYEWKERVNKGEPVGASYGKIRRFLNHSFVLWREGGKLYAVGPIQNYGYDIDRGRIIKGNANRVICIEDAFDYIVYDTEINPSLAYAPLSVCRLLEEMLASMEDSDDAFYMRISENMTEESGYYDDILASSDNCILDRGVQYIGTLDKYWNNQPCIHINKLNHLQFTIKSQEENSVHVNKIACFPNRLLNAVIDEDESLEEEERIRTATEYLKDKLFVFRSKPRRGDGNSAWSVYVTEQPKYYDETDPFAMIPVFAGKDAEEEKAWNEKRIEKEIGEWDFRREYKNFSEWKECVNDRKPLGVIYGRYCDFLSHSFVLWREGKKLYAVGPIDKCTYNKGWVLEGNTNRVICITDALDKIVYDLEINPSLAYVPLSVCRLLEETLENMEDSDAMLNVSITGNKTEEPEEEWEETVVKEEAGEIKVEKAEEYVNIPVFAGKNDTAEAEWNRKREEQGEKRRRFGRRYEDFSEWKDRIKSRKSMGETFNCPPEKHNHTFVLWREEGELYAVGPVKNISKSGMWILAGNFVQRVLLHEITDKVIYDTKENPTLARIALSECEYIEKRLEEMKEKEKEELGGDTYISLYEDRYGLQRGIWHIGVLDYNRKNQPSVFINKRNQLQLAFKSQEEISFHVHDIPSYSDCILNTVLDEDKHAESRMRTEAATECLQNKLFLFSTGPWKNGGEIARAVYVKDRPKYYDETDPFAIIPVFAGKNDFIERIWNQERVKKGFDVRNLRREYEDFNEWKDYVNNGKPLGEVKGRITNYLIHSFVLWREGKRLYAIGPISKYSDSARGWIIEGNTKRVICITDAPDKIVYDVEFNPTLAYVPLSVCRLLEETLENMEDSDDILNMSITGNEEAKDIWQEGPDYYVDIPVFAEKNASEEEEWNRKREASGKKRLQLDRSYKDFSELEERITKGKMLGRTHLAYAKAYFQSFVLWREEGELYVVGPVEKDTIYESEWRFTGNKIKKICLSEVTDKVIYNVEENPTLAQLLLADCRLIEEKLKAMKEEAEKNPLIDVPVFAGKNDIEEEKWNSKRKEQGYKRKNFIRGYADYSEWENRIKKGKGIGLIYGCDSVKYEQSFVLWREEGKLYAVGPVENEKEKLHWQLKGNFIQKISLEEITNDVKYDTEENPTRAQLLLSECRLIEEKLEEMKLRAQEAEEYVAVPVFSGKTDEEEETESVTNVKFPGVLYSGANAFQNYSFVLWREGKVFYATGPIQKYSYDNDKGWILGGDTKREICITQSSDEIIYDAESNSSWAFIPLSVYQRLEKGLEKKRESETEPQSLPKKEICEKPKVVNGVRRVHTSRAWKYIDRN